ncbi:MAG: AAA family ATPase [Candidatus Levybacteria bacterium]|nr:AAA family ATPase [Candidatus Levybacteria bacterium]
MTKVIAIVGMPGAGKSEASNFFTEKGFERLYFGSVVIDGLKEESLERTAENEKQYREKIRKELGMAAVAIKMFPGIQEEADKSKKIVLDGLYGWEEYLFLKEKLPSLILLCIYAKPNIRYQRLSERQERTFSKEEARKRDVDEIEGTNKGGPIAIADYLIKNEGTKEDFMKELEKFLNLFENDKL